MSKPPDFKTDWAEFVRWLEESQAEVTEIERLLETTDGKPREPWRWSDSDLARVQAEAEADGQKLGFLFGGVVGFLAGLIACATGLV